jgi:hypothetical protein
MANPMTTSRRHDRPTQPPTQPPPILLSHREIRVVSVVSGVGRSARHLRGWKTPVAPNGGSVGRQGVVSDGSVGKPEPIRGLVWAKLRVVRVSRSVGIVARRMKLAPADRERVAALLLADNGGGMSSPGNG